MDDNGASIAHKPIVQPCDQHLSTQISQHMTKMFAWQSGSQSVLLPGLFGSNCQLDQAWWPPILVTSHHGPGNSGKYITGQNQNKPGLGVSLSFKLLYLYIGLSITEQFTCIVQGYILVSGPVYMYQYYTMGMSLRIEREA